ncbi:hypothetical protein MD588_19705 [Photobacterium sp. SDRW27]|uniref:hypothetical protein n=1 Tax=Photobacterium obscurum TaxID=2829490 RepID=UPI0022448FA3|nr:hypothetical protein [Photobacterium obscurum]MCW8331024.1 hypothetical protein [Photobacterium obscurum]
MKSATAERSESIQKEMEELKARLRQGTQAMQSSPKQDESTEFMSLIIKSTATFEKN